MHLTYTSRMMECRRDGYEEGLHTGLTTGREEGISIGLEQGLKRGIERGVHQKALETARKLLDRGDSPAEIADLLSLSVSQVQELVENR